MNRADIPPALLSDVKNYLNITWEDQATDDKICGLIASASMYIDSKCGASQDYEADGYPRTILMEHVRYARDEALDVFENNYAHLIIAMQTEKDVSAYVERTE